MSNLSSSQFGPDETLPGMSRMVQARPHEQTESQFHNRPDVFWHGRFSNADDPQSKMPTERSWDFHAGTEQSAVDRMNDLGRRKGILKEPRFYAGRVDSSRMGNKPPSGSTPKDIPEGQEVKNYHPELIGARGVPVVTPAKDDWRKGDQGEDWGHEDGNHYYRNEYEDPGTTSVILHDQRRQGASLNFKPWRAHVSEALRSGVKVPSHVQAVYHATGGEEGPVTNHLPGYKEPGEKVGRYATTENVIQDRVGGSSSWTTGMYQENQALKKKQEAHAQKVAQKLKPKGS